MHNELMHLLALRLIILHVSICIDEQLSFGYRGIQLIQHDKG